MNEFAGVLKNVVVIDLETTGLDCNRHSILEIGAVDGAGRMFYRRVKASRKARWFTPQYAYQDAALRCNGIAPHELHLGVPVEEAIGDLMDWLFEVSGRWTMVCKNPNFDYEFIKANWSFSEPIRKFISRRVVDIHSIAYGSALGRGEDIASGAFKTDELYEQIGIDREPMPHNAVRGAVHEMECLCRLLGIPHLVDWQFEMLMDFLTRENVQDGVTDGETVYSMLKKLILSKKNGGVMK